MSYNRRNFLKTTGQFVFAANTLPFLLNCPSKPKKRPNILLFFPDQYRPDWISVYNKLPIKTPNIDVLAERGVNFTKAVCPAPLCAPSRSCLASGKEYDRCGCPTNGHNYPVEQTTFYTLLRESGYHVLGCGKFDLRKPAESWGRDGKQVFEGTDYMKLWGFSDGIDNSGKHDGPRAYARGKVCPYFDYLESKGLANTHMDDFAKRPFPNFANTDPTPLPEEAYADNYLARNGLQLLAEAPNNKPWFLQVNFNGPHEPMDVTKNMRNAWKNVPFPQPHNNNQYTPEKHVAIRQNYAAMLENIDKWLGIYMEEIKKRGELENTVVVFSADHGEMLGDHNLWQKSIPYQPSAGVPLVIAGPGVRQNYTCELPVTNMDLAATFLEFAGVEIPKDMDSRSMLPLLEGKTNVHRKFVKSGLYGWRMVFDGRYKLIKGFSISKENKADIEPILFDLQTDPKEDKNIAKQYPEIVQKLSQISNLK